MEKTFLLEVNMEDQLIQFKTAVLAKEKGFEIKTRNWYNQIECLEPTSGFGGAMCYENVGYAPTQALLQKWLRDTHNIHIYIEPIWNTYQETLSGEVKPLYIGWWIAEQIEEDEPIETFYKTYEEALEDALQDSLKHIKI